MIDAFTVPNATRHAVQNGAAGQVMPAARHEARIERPDADTRRTDSFYMVFGDGRTSAKEERDAEADQTADAEPDRVSGAAGGEDHKESAQQADTPGRGVAPEATGAVTPNHRSSDALVTSEAATQMAEQEPGATRVEAGADAAGSGDAALPAAPWATPGGNGTEARVVNGFALAEDAGATPDSVRPDVPAISRDAVPSSTAPRGPDAAGAPPQLAAGIDAQPETPAPAEPGSIDHAARRQDGGGLAEGDRSDEPLRTPPQPSAPGQTVEAARRAARSDLPDDRTVPSDRITAPPRSGEALTASVAGPLDQGPSGLQATLRSALALTSPAQTARTSFGSGALDEFGSPATVVQPGNALPLDTSLVPLPTSQVPGATVVPGPVAGPGQTPSTLIGPLAIGPAAIVPAGLLPQVSGPQGGADIPVPAMAPGAIPPTPGETASPSPLLSDARTTLLPDAPRAPTVPFGDVRGAVDRGTPPGAGTRGGGEYGAQRLPDMPVAALSVTASRMAPVSPVNGPLSASAAVAGLVATRQEGPATPVNPESLRGVEGLLPGDLRALSDAWRPGADAPKGPGRAADIARQLSAHVAATGAARGPGGHQILEITLNPAELGRVRLTLQAGEAAMVVTIAADRPETLDLMRRHVDVLAQEFRDIGYDSAGFSFGQEAAGQDGQPAEGQGSGTGPDLVDLGMGPGGSAGHPGLHTDGLDIRL